MFGAVKRLSTGEHGDAGGCFSSQAIEVGSNGVREETTCGQLEVVPVKVRSTSGRKATGTDDDGVPTSKSTEVLDASSDCGIDTTVVGVGCRIVTTTYGGVVLHDCGRGRVHVTLAKGQAGRTSQNGCTGNE